MRNFCYAILAAALALMLLPGPGPLKDPLKVSFELADGVRIRGELKAWDGDGFDGTFGRRRWSELKADDVWKLHLLLIDQRSTEQWAQLGRVLLEMTEAQPKARQLAEDAFAKAIKLDPGAASEIQRVRDEISRRSQLQRHLAALATQSPESIDWPADPWPALSPAEQRAAVLTMRADAQRLAVDAALNAMPIESERFIVCSDLPRAEAAGLIVQLEKAHDFLARLLSDASGGGPQDQADQTGAPVVSWGKIVVFIFREQDKFLAFQANAFEHLASRATVASCHPLGPKVFLSAFLPDDRETLQWSLIRATVHGLMHRHRTPRRLPAWANEGLADFVAGRLMRRSRLYKDRRWEALQFIRNGGDVNALLDLDYSSLALRDSEHLARSVCGLIVEVMISDRRRRFVQWINAVKGGEEWQAALREDFGTSRDALITTFVRYRKVND